MMHPARMVRMSAARLRIGLPLIATMLACCSGCALLGQHDRNVPGAQPISTADPLDITPLDPATETLDAARNEWVSFVLRLDNLPKPSARFCVLQLRPPQLQTASHALPLSAFSAYQVLSVPVQANRPAYVRHTGLPGGQSTIPRVLLPLAYDASNGIVNLDALRDPDRPADPAARAGGPGTTPPLIWVDLHIPPLTPPGRYDIPCQVTRPGYRTPYSQTILHLNVRDFALPDTPHLNLVSQLSWTTLLRLYPDQFQGIPPRLLSRADPACAPAVSILDQLVALAHDNHVQVIVPRLQPTVKWVTADQPQFDWTDFDSLVTPWLTGSAFADRMPLAFWPLPTIDYLDNYSLPSRLDYWQQAAVHFDQLGWLAAAPAPLYALAPRALDMAEARTLSAEAAALIEHHPRLSVMLPLDHDHVGFAAPGQSAAPGLIDPQLAGRLLLSAPGLIGTAQSDWPQSLPHPQQWLRPDQSGLTPYAAAGTTESDLRLWAWLAFLRQCQLVVWSNLLPTTTGLREPADPADLVWFYPGQWFGTDRPLPTIQLKWLRRAQQDYEYLYIARQRQQTDIATTLARLLVRPVNVQAGHAPEPAYELLCGTSSLRLWSQAQDLLTRAILLQSPGRADDPEADNALSVDLLRWTRTQERPILLPRSTQWGFSVTAPGPARLADVAESSDFPSALLSAGHAPRSIDLRLGIDIYTAAQTQPDPDAIQWTTTPTARGWHMPTERVSIPTLAPFTVRHAFIDARCDLDQLITGTGSPSRHLAELTFINGYTDARTPLHLVLPIAVSDRRDTDLDLDGSLNEWTADDLLQDGPMVRMLNRPAVQDQQLEFAAPTATVYSAWTDEQFCVAFSLNGVSGNLRAPRNFVDYEAGRPWGEDLCEILIQPVYADNRLGPVLHIVCKPGGPWLSRKLDDARNPNPWQPIVGAPVRYAGTLNDNVWRGELAIPWQIINDPAAGSTRRPALLRFNFSRHQASTGDSSSWAGPIDSARDDSFTGLLYLRNLTTPGMHGSRIR